jgi:hypothetical protein
MGVILQFGEGVAAAEIPTKVLAHVWTSGLVGAVMRLPGTA